MAIHTRGKKKQRGSILLLAFFFLIVLFGLSTAFYRIIPAEFHSANHSRQQVEASFAADSGARSTVAWLRFRQMNNTPIGIITRDQIETYNTEHYGSHSDDYDPMDWPSLSRTDTKLVAHQVDENWSFLSRIRMDDSDFFQKIYTVESCSYFRGKPRQVTKIVVQNQNFAEYALYISDWDENFIYSMSPGGIQGPVHTNGFPRVSAGDVGFWTATDSDGNPAEPWVSGPLAKITHVGRFAADSTSPNNTLNLDADGLQYANGNSFASSADLVPFDDTTGTPIAERYAKIVEGGRENISQVTEVPMPNDSNELRTESWGGTIPSNMGTASNGYDVMVPTDTGLANDPTGTVNGGIFINDRNVNDLLLDITPEGHQKIRIRQGGTTVNDPSRDSYDVEVPRYVRDEVIPPTTRTVTFCPPANQFTREVDRYGWIYFDEEVTRANASRCGTETQFVPGEGGISEPIEVALVCTYTQRSRRWGVVGTRTVNDCTAYDTREEPVDGYTQTVPAEAGDPGAYQDGVTIDNRDTPPTDGTPYTLVEGRRNIQNWNSVVEVNDADYNIPYYSGMEINGETITDPTDPRLVVSDGNTVFIETDTVSGGQDFAKYTVMNGRTNGVVFSDVNLYNVRGTNKGSKYEDINGTLKYQGRVLATNIASNKRMEIQDSILQYYDGNDNDADGNPLNDGNNRLVPGFESPNESHILGLLAARIDIDPRRDSDEYVDTNNNRRERSDRPWETGGRAFLGGDFRGDMNVYGILMAGRTRSNGAVEGGFGTSNNGMQGRDNLGDFNLYGGIISGEARKTQRNTGGDNNGFRLGLNYDQVAATYLSYFPVTPNFDALRYVTYTAGTEYFDR